MRACGHRGPGLPRRFQAPCKLQAFALINDQRRNVVGGLARLVHQHRLRDGDHQQRKADRAQDRRTAAPQHVTKPEQRRKARQRKQ